MGDLPHEHYLAQSGYQIDPKPEPSDFSGLRLTARGRTRSARLRRARFFDTRRLDGTCQFSERPFKAAVHG